MAVSVTWTAESGVSTTPEAKPQAPLRITRTAKPTSSVSEAPWRRPSRTRTSWDRIRSNRKSAWVTWKSRARIKAASASGGRGARRTSDRSATKTCPATYPGIRALRQAGPRRAEGEVGSGLAVHLLGLVEGRAPHPSRWPAGRRNRRPGRRRTPARRRRPGPRPRARAPARRSSVDLELARRPVVAPRPHQHERIRQVVPREPGERVVAAVLGAPGQVDDVVDLGQGLDDAPALLEHRVVGGRRKKAPQSLGRVSTKRSRCRTSARTPSRSITASIRGGPVGLTRQGPQAPAGRPLDRGCGSSTRRGTCRRAPAPGSGCAAR